MSGASNDQGQLTVGLDVSDKHVHACFFDHHVRIVCMAQRLASGSPGLVCCCE